MDAYAFAATATTAGLTELKDLVGEGQLRVTVELEGAYEAYAAATGDDRAEALDRIDAVRSVAGLTGVEVVVAEGASVDTASLPITPTWGGVDDFVVFLLVQTAGAAGTAAAHRIATLPRLVGLASLEGDVPTLLAELTGSSVAELEQSADRVRGMPGVVSVKTSVGEVARGAGFTIGSG